MRLGERLFHVAYCLRTEPPTYRNLSLQLMTPLGVAVVKLFSAFTVAEAPETRSTAHQTMF
jgi:hypothetical protein